MNMSMIRKIVDAAELAIKSGSKDQMVIDLLHNMVVDLECDLKDTIKDIDLLKAYFKKIHEHAIVSMNKMNQVAIFSTNAEGTTGKLLKKIEEFAEEGPDVS